MMTPSPPTPSFGQLHFGTAALRDQRRTRSLVDVADRLARHPGGTLPDKFSDPNALRRCYDLMNCPHVTHAAVLRPHCDRTRVLLAEHQGVVLLLHDTTVLDFSSRKTLHDQLGPIGNGQGHGYLCVNSLAVDASAGTVFGLVNQILHVPVAVPAGETLAQKRQRETRESRVWLQAVDGSGPAPAGYLWVDVCDRGADTFEFLAHEHQQQRHYVLRICHDRRIRAGHHAEAPRTLLWAHLRSLPEQGRREVYVHSHDGRPGRRATVALRWAAVQVLPPHNQRGLYRKEPLAVWAIYVREVGPPPPGSEAVEWVLLTNVAVATVEQSWERVHWYENRWVVEELHKAQKTGCGIENPQFEEVERLEPMIALLSVVAVGLLQLRDASRDEAQQGQPATAVVHKEYVEVLSGWRYRERRPLTVREFFLALARLGGHQNRNKDQPPGWLVLWRGWTKLHLLAEGARASRRPTAKTRAARRQKPLRSRRKRYP